MNIKKIMLAAVLILACVGGLFVYEVNKEHPYTPKTAEIVINSREIAENTFVLYNDPVVFNMAEHISFVSDVENGTANLETRKKVFGFYECDINRVFEEYLPAVSYSIADESIATVTEEGVVTALAKGATVLTVTADEIQAEIPVVVYKAVSVDRLEREMTLLKGDKKALLQLGDYEVPRAEFYSTDEKVATVDKNGNIAAINKGKTEIYTFRDEAKTEKISTKVTVKQPVESVTMKHLSVYVGQTATLKGSYSPRNADYGTKLSYKSENPEIATVNGNIVTGVKAGDAVIVITSANGKTGKAGVKVVSPPRANPVVQDVSKAEFEAFGGEKFTDNSPYASYFKITFDQPVSSFRINTISHDAVTMTTGGAIYNYAQVPANTPVYFAICINHSDVVITRGFSYVNRDGSSVKYTLHQSLKDGSTLSQMYNDG